MTKGLLRPHRDYDFQTALDATRWKWERKLANVENGRFDYQLFEGDKLVGFVAEAFVNTADDVCGFCNMYRLPWHEVDRDEGESPCDTCPAGDVEDINTPCGRISQRVYEVGSKMDAYEVCFDALLELDKLELEHGEEG